MASLNLVQLIGNLGDDPKVDRLQTGAIKASLSLATTKRSFTTQSGSIIPEKTEWHKVIVWGKMAETLERYAKKGMQIYVIGEITSRSYEKEGQTHYVTEIQCLNFQFLDRKQNDGNGYGNGQQYGGQAPTQSYNPGPANPIEPGIDPVTGQPNDDLPF